jgi:phage repressor protein C with HTH and peptisase S24 domain
MRYDKDMRYDNDLLDDLMREVAVDVEAGDLANHSSEWLLRWLASDLRLGMSGQERTRDEQESSVFAHRISARIAARRAARKFPVRELRQRPARNPEIIRDSLSQSAREGCAALLDLAVAAGTGRELWDESTDAWLELPDDIPPSERYVALRVAGDSMSPVLEPRDVILLKLGPDVAVDELVVAQIPDQGYVVKYVSAVKDDLIELTSFNPDYGTLSIPRYNHAIAGTVLARFRRTQ